MDRRERAPLGRAPHGRDPHERGLGFLGFVSGHTLKHLLATVGAGWLVRMLLLRQATGEGAPSVARPGLPAAG